MTITMGSVCSGIEAASVACEPLGIKTVWVSEIEPFPCAVLEHHWPQVPNLGDMNHIVDLIKMGIDAPDILVGGTPCQAFSVAGLREGLSDPRGMLTQTFVKIGDAIDERRPGNESVIWWENVPGVLSSKDNAFGCFLGALAGEDCELVPAGKKWTNAGCVFGPKRAVAWRVLDAQYFGVAQRRRRVFVVASARAGFNPAAVLFESEGVRRDTPPSREARSAVAALTANGVGTCGADDNQGQAGHLVPVLSVHGTQDPDTNVELAHTLGRNNGVEGAVCVTGNITHTLKAEGFDASEDGTGRGQPIVPVSYGMTTEQTPKFNEECALTLTKQSPTGGGQPQACMTRDMTVRRLTPVECERLQGFPDGHTDVPYRNKPSADGPRYKAIGNSMAVPVMRWIGGRIVKELSKCP